MSKPVPEKFQLRARLRRLRQQLRDGKITRQQYDDSFEKAEKDYRKKP